MAVPRREVLASRTPIPRRASRELIGSLNSSAQKQTRLKQSLPLSEVLTRDHACNCLDGAPNEQPTALIILGHMIAWRQHREAFDREARPEGQQHRR